MGLFNTTHIHNGKTELVPYCQKIEVNEKRAPTDESVRLLNEMQEKAKKNIISIIEIKENWIQAICIYYTDEAINNRLNFQMKFILNNNEYFIESHINKHDWNNEYQGYLGLGSEIVYKKLIKRFSEAIADEMFKQIPNPFNL